MLVFGNADRGFIWAARECDFTELPIFDTIKSTTVRNCSIIVCRDCKTNMASFPPSMYSARKLREAQTDHKIAKISPSQGNQFKFFPKNYMELNPQKYNSKLMDSIWGIYNRYSPHNFKKNNIHNDSAMGGLQQTAAVSPKIEGKSPGNGLPQSNAIPKFENLWTGINMSQSH